jgi:putative CocE/NonD family hydrolase
LHRAFSRPVVDAADGALTGDFRTHFRDCLAHPTYDDWWQARTLAPADYAQIDLPTLVITGHFDGSVGSLALWRGLEAHAATPANRQLLIGPWDHGQCYSGGQPVMGPYQLGEASVRDLGALRIAFFDRHLKGEGPGPALAARVTVFITGANEWREFAAFPPAEVTPQSLWLASGGHANTARGDGRLAPAAPAAGQAPDSFTDDPAWPFVGAIAEATGRGWDLRERARDQETLVYTGETLTAPLTLLGQPEAELFTACDAPDADLFIWLSELRADGSQVQLAAGQLRLRYHAGFDAERPLTPGEPVRVRIPLAFIGHQLPAGSRLQLLIAGSNFPQADPNPHGAGPVATATTLASAVQTIFHDPARPSRLILQVLP